MDAEQARSLLRKLPHAEETMQWGANLVYWVGDKAIGGKMFALVNLDQDRDPDKPTPVIMFYAGPERYAELLETEGVVPAPYMARIYWVALTHWNVFRRSEFEALLRAANEGVYSRLPKRVHQTLALPVAEREKLVIARRKVLDGRATASRAPIEKAPAKKAPAKKRIPMRKGPGSR
jgi:predicted DNA-binding protein (MmcQ/YjbR family)